MYSLNGKVNRPAGRVGTDLVRPSSIAYLFTQLFFCPHIYQSSLFKKGDGGIEEVRLDLMPALAFDAHLDDTCELF